MRVKAVQGVVSSLPDLEDREYQPLKDFLAEINFGVNKFGNYRSKFEAYAVIKEEFDELWDELRTKNADSKRIYEEAIQVAATAYRLAEEIQIGWEKLEK